VFDSMRDELIRESAALSNPYVMQCSTRCRLPYILVYGFGV
jgi:hypothetical protein